MNIQIINYQYTRKSVDNDSMYMYIFTDNNQRTSSPNALYENIDIDSWYYKKYKPRTNKPLHFGSLHNPTSAIIRGLNNAYPISTMSSYGTNWEELEFDVFKKVIDDEIEQIKKDSPMFEGIKIGNYRIGQGGRFARIPPKLQNYLDTKLKEIYIDNTKEKPSIIFN